VIEDGSKPAWFRWGAVALGLAVAVLLALWLRDMLMSSKPSKPMKLQQITLIRPPPPPKPPEEKPPEPKVKDEVKIDEPQPTPEQTADAPPPGADLGVDADGTSGSDGFGLVGKKGAADLVGGGSRGNPWAGYDTMVNDVVNSAFQTALSREKTLKNKSYKVIVKVWIGAGGQVTRMALVDSTGDVTVDDLLKDVLRNLALRGSPPEDMPQPMKIRVTSRA